MLDINHRISGQTPRVCAPPGSANRGGNPKGHATAAMVLGPFAETKGPPRLPGRLPARKFIEAYIHFYLGHSDYEPATDTSLSQSSTERQQSQK